MVRLIQKVSPRKADEEDVLLISGATASKNLKLFPLFLSDSSVRHVEPRKQESNA